MNTRGQKSPAFAKASAFVAMLTAADKSAGKEVRDRSTAWPLATSALSGVNWGGSPEEHGKTGFPPARE